MGTNKNSNNGNNFLSNKSKTHDLVVLSTLLYKTEGVHVAQRQKSRRKACVRLVTHDDHTACSCGPAASKNDLETLPAVAMSVPSLDAIRFTNTSAFCAAINHQFVYGLA